MNEMIFLNFWEMHPKLNYDENSSVVSKENFENDDNLLREEARVVIEKRKDIGLEGIVKGLKCVIINTEEENQVNSAQEFLNYTGYDFYAAFENNSLKTIILKKENSADLFISCRKNPSPFKDINTAQKSEHMVNTRLETLIFEVTDIKKYVDIQKSRGVQFMSRDIIHTDKYDIIQTIPSSFTGNSIGFIQWNGEKGDYFYTGSKQIEVDIKKPNKDYLKNIKELDHAATRIKAKERDAAVIEFMELTNYHFDFAIYVDSLNSITNVVSLSDGEFAMVFTAGISPYKNEEESGPTEKYVHNYGTRVHHLAFNTENIEDTFENLKNDGMIFLSELIGSENEGVKQAFSTSSKNTILVNEYIHRYGEFDGSFTKNNVYVLTESTNKQ